MDKAKGLHSGSREGMWASWTRKKRNSLLQTLLHRLVSVATGTAGNQPEGLSILGGVSYILHGPPLIPPADGTQKVQLYLWSL